MTFLVLQHDPDLPLGLLETLLTERTRVVRLVRRWEDPAPAPLEDLRAVVVLGGDGQGGPPAPDAVDVPTLHIAGRGEGPMVYLPVTRTDDVGDDPLFAAYPDGMPALSLGAVLAEPAGAVVLARFPDGGAAGIRAGHAYTLGFHPELTAEHVAAFGDEALTEEARRRDRFHQGMGASLLGRWIDEAVGRTEAEAPWGRRGPQPVPRPGLSLHPA